MKSTQRLRKMPRRPTLFWDVDPKTIDQKKHARYIIERIMDFGTDQEVRWMWQTYPKVLLKKTLAQPRSPLLNKSKALWALLLE